jgi:hypothetical protein
MCNAQGHPEGHACGFGPPYPYAFPIDSSEPLPPETTVAPVGPIRVPGLRSLPDWLVADLSSSLPEPVIPLYDDIAEGTLDLSRPGEVGAAKPWEPEQVEAFDKEIAAMEATVEALRDRVAQADREGRRLNAEDMEWLNSKQLAGPTGYRSKHYRTSLPCVQDTIDDYESVLNPATWRHLLRLIQESVRLKGEGYMNRVMYEVEIGRVSEYRDLLEARRDRKVREREVLEMAP